MMRGLGLVALLGAGACFLLCTDKGRQLTKQIGARAKEGLDFVEGEIRSRTGVQGTINNALEKPHADTAVARAMEEAVG
jgi:hypothetical protein